MFKKLRIALLLFLLFMVAAGTWLHQRRLTDWNESLWVVVYPIAGDTTPRTQRYLQRLNTEHFRPIETFVARQARQYRKRVTRPVKMILGDEIRAMPPEPPANGSVLSIMAWSLRLRYWAWQHESGDLLGDVSIFVIYHNPEHSPRVPHSLGMKEGSIGVVHAFAGNDTTQSNNVVIAHELLHTLGASDKYDLSNGLPIHPAGYADPDKRPRYPQDRAEIMGGRIPLSPGRAAIPRGLNQTVIGPVTASEIGW